jgi:L-seryl-tRNA(Ser) seleniumtransferase
MNNSPNGDTLCRTNKVNKEEMIGMLTALELYLEQDRDAEWADWEARCETVAAAVRDIPSVKTEVFVPEIANHAPHLRITWDYAAKGLNPPQVVKTLQDGSPSIEVRPGSEEWLDIAVWMLEPGEAEIVAEKVKAALS